MKNDKNISIFSEDDIIDELNFIDFKTDAIETYFIEILL